MGNCRLLLLCERGGFAPLHQAASAAASMAASGGRADIVLFHAALARLLDGETDSVDDDQPSVHRYREALDRGRVRPVSEVLANARRDGVGLFACSASVALLGREPEQISGIVDETVGWPTILRWMESSDQVLYL
jgi:peroxiredoxin family protein